MEVCDLVVGKTYWYVPAIIPIEIIFMGKRYQRKDYYFLSEGKRIQLREWNLYYVYDSYEKAKAEEAQIVTRIYG